MVREQEPPRNPLAPSQGRIMSQKQDTNSKAPQTEYDDSDALFQPVTTSLFGSNSPAPVFGQTTDLSHNASPLAKRQQHPSKLSARSNVTSNYDNLFSKRKPDPVTYHKPPQNKNPLSSAGGLYSQPLSNPRRIPDTSNSSDNAFRIQKPSNPAVQQWRAPQPATFSSGHSTDVFYQTKPDFVDLTKPRNLTKSEGFSDDHVFGNDKFGTTDPYMYLDAGQASDSIKGLLEGALDDEDDKPRTRRKKKEINAKVDELTKKMQGANIKEDPKAEKAENDQEEEEEDDGTREGLKVKLLPHQIEGVEWMRNKELGTKKVKGILPKGGILADDMGLGKTIQSIALILSNRRPTDEELETSKLKLDPKTGKATLVVAPLALIKQWEGELRDRVDEDHALKVLVHHGPSRSKSHKDLRKYDVVITTYQTLSSEHADGGADSLKSALFGVNWYRIILDEAHSIKNRNAKSTKAACALNSEYRWCLSGTPMQNHLDEVQSLIHFLRIKPYDNLENWREQITKPMNNGRGGLSIRRLRAFLSAIMKRRTKDILKQDDNIKPSVGGAETKSKNGFKIVKRTIENVAAQFTEEERTFYQSLEARTDKSLKQMMAGNQISYASALVLLMRLRQACNHPKLLGYDLAKEQEATGSRTPGRKASKADDVDDIANMLGGLSMGTKRCDICQIELSTEAVEDDMIRCTECEEDLLAQERPKKQKEKKQRTHVKRERRTNRKLVLDSDDEEGDDSHVNKTFTRRNLVLDSDDEDDATPRKLPNSGSYSEDTDSEEFDDSDERNSESDLVASTKIRQLIKILQHDSSSHKYIVFSFFTSMLDLIEPFLYDNDIAFVRYDGKMKNHAREAALESLRNEPRTRVLLCSLRAGSLGLNLTAASRVVILEPFWNPFVEEQAIDRVHRLNQTQDVVVHKLTIEDTVEARILELQDKKRELANATIEGYKAPGAAKLTLNDMLKLFRHDSEIDAKLDMIGMTSKQGVLEKGESTARSSDQLHKPKERKEDPIYGRRW